MDAKVNDDFEEAFEQFHIGQGQNWHRKNSQFGLTTKRGDKAQSQNRVKDG